MKFIETVSNIYFLTKVYVKNNKKLTKYLLKCIISSKNVF